MGHLLNTEFRKKSCILAVFLICMTKIRLIPCISYRLHPISTTEKSLTLVPVGPVLMRPSHASNM